MQLFASLISGMSDALASLQDCVFVTFYIYRLINRRADGMQITITHTNVPILTTT